MSESLTIQNLTDKWSQVKASQGIIGKAWNGVKEFLNVHPNDQSRENDKRPG